MPGIFTSATANRAGIKTDAAGTLGKHLAMHKMASGQDFWQSGKDGFSSGQQGMLSDMEAMSDIAAREAFSFPPARDGVTIGAARKLTTARIESR